MCKELNEELEDGKEAATTLAWHLKTMGADRATIPVKVEGVDFLITVERKKAP